MSHRSLAEFLDHVTESFSNLFNIGVDSALSEAENVQKVIGQTATVAWIVSAAVPIPASDFVVLTPIQAKMAVQIGRIKGFEIDKDRAAEIVTEILGVIGMSLTAQMLIVSVAKLVPFVGGFLAGPLVYASTWAIGYVVNYYFDCLRQGSTPSAETMKDLFAEQFRVGKRRSEDVDRNDLKRQAEELRQKVAAKNPEFTTTTRLDGRSSTRPRPAAATPPAPKPVAKGPRPKIKITLPSKGESAAPTHSVQKKTIGFGDEAPTEAPAEAAATKPAEPTSAPKATGGLELVQQLERLAHLRTEGVLTEEEFLQAKERLLK